MLAKPTTKDFIQIRTAPIKLRRALQNIQFITPLEIEHAIIRTAGNESEIVTLLQHEGYNLEEIERAIMYSISSGNIISHDNIYRLNPKRVAVVRRYCILDIIANYGKPISIDIENGCLLVAGFETSWGLPQNEVVKTALKVFPLLNELWDNLEVAFDDIQWLIDKGFIITR